MKCLMLLSLLLTAITASAAHERPESQGWHWYNEPREQDRVAQASPVPASPEEQMSLLKQHTRRALNHAILYPGVESFSRFIRLQNFWLSQAGKFAMAGRETLLARPELDYNLRYSHYNGTVESQLAEDRKKQAQAIQALTAAQGLIFFYRGKSAIDRQMAEVVSHFVRTHEIALIPVAIDNTPVPSLPHSRPDRGQVARLGIRHFPALMLASPDSQQVRPLAYGFLSADDLARRFLDVASGFRPQF